MERNDGDCLILKIENNLFLGRDVEFFETEYPFASTTEVVSERILTHVPHDEDANLDEEELDKGVEVG
jgi:hypothetical protein